LQSKLPDTNQAWVYYRHLGVQALQEKRYSEAVAAINEMIALFPDEYRIEINTEKYNQLMRVRTVFVCEHCSTETSRTDIKVYDCLLSTIEGFCIGSDYAKIWNCPNCQKDNMLQNTKMIEEQNGLPFYHKLIPEPPFKQGTKNRKTFDNDFKKWFYDSLEEVDHQLGKLRAEYEGLQSLEEEGNQDAN